MRAWLAITIFVGAFFLGRLTSAVWLDGATDLLPTTAESGSEEKRKHLEEKIRKVIPAEFH